MAAELDIATATLAELAAAAAGNWYAFDCFSWRDQPADSDNWMLWHFETRDDELTARANAIVIRRELRRYCVGRSPAVREDVATHWACGRVSGYAIRVFSRFRGKITDAFCKVVDLKRRLAAYPLLDENEHSKLEYADTLANILQVAQPSALVRLTPARLRQLWSALDEAGELECVDDRGAWPGQPAVRAALAGCGWLSQ